MPRLSFDRPEAMHAEFDALVRRDAGGEAQMILERLVARHVVEETAPPGYDGWMREQIEEGLRALDGPEPKLIPHDEVMAEWRAQRRDLERRAAKKAS